MKREILFLSIFIFICVFMGTTFSYASQKMSFKDDQISIVFPDNWLIASENSIPEILAGNLDIELSELEDIVDYPGEIFLAAKMMNSVNVEEEIYYMYYENDYSNSAEPLSEESLIKFHNNFGQDAIKNYILYGLDAKLELEQSHIFKGENQSFLKVPMTFYPEEASPEKRILYYTPKGDSLIAVILRRTDNKALTKSQINECETVLKTFNDTGYYKSDEFISDGMWNFLFFLRLALVSIVISLILLFARKLYRKNQKERNNDIIDKQDKEQKNKNIEEDEDTPNLGRKVDI